MWLRLFSIFALTISCLSCQLKKAEAKAPKEIVTTNSETSAVNPAETFIISTGLGNMEVRLYDETPQHQKNFTDLVAKKYFDSLLFHRVIKDFMIQGGDPNSKGAKATEMLGQGGPGYTVPAEFNDKLIHKKGALAAARQPDQVNPLRASSGSQFYIVQGRIHTADELTKIEQYINEGRRQYLGYSLFNSPKNKAIKKKVTYFQSKNKADSLNFYLQKIETQLNDSFPKIEFKYSQQAKHIYQTIGGTPQLDGTYTVFGEVTKGLELIDSIANQPTGEGDRPITDITISIKKKINDGR